MCRQSFSTNAAGLIRYPTPHPVLDREHRLRGVLGTGARRRGPNTFYTPEAVLARTPYVWMIDTYNDRAVLLRVETR